MAASNSRNRLLASGAIALLAIGAIAFALGDLHEFIHVAADLRPVPVVLAICAGLAAYLGFTAVLAVSTRAAGYQRRYGELLATSFVSQALNNLFSVGGLGGVAVRIYGMGRLGIPAGAALAISSATTIMGDAVVALAIHIGVALLAIQGRLSVTAMLWLGAIAVVFNGVTLTFLWRLRIPQRRENLLAKLGDWSARVARRLGNRDLESGAPLAKFQRDLLEAVREMIAKPSRLAPAYLWAWVDMALRVSCLAFAFRAVGHPLPFPDVFTGLMIGITAGALSFVPGGIGVIEGSMSAAFVFMGVPLEVAVVAVIVFRFSYYVFPLALVAIFFRGMMRGASIKVPAPRAGPLPSEPVAEPAPPPGPPARP